MKTHKFDSLYTNSWSLTIVNRIINGLEAYLQNDRMLKESMFWSKNRYLSHNAPMEFLRKQPIAECWTPVFMHNKNNWPN